MLIYLTRRIKVLLRGSEADLVNRKELISHSAGLFGFSLLGPRVRRWRTPWLLLETRSLPVRRGGVYFTGGLQGGDLQLWSQIKLGIIHSLTSFHGDTVIMPFTYHPPQANKSCLQWFVMLERSLHRQIMFADSPGAKFVWAIWKTPSWAGNRVPPDLTNWAVCFYPCSSPNSSSQVGEI